MMKKTVSIVALVAIIIITAVFIFKNNLTSSLFSAKGVETIELTDQLVIPDPNFIETKEQIPDTMLDIKSQQVDNVAEDSNKSLDKKPIIKNNTEEENEKTRQEVVDDLNSLLLTWKADYQANCTNDNTKDLCPILGRTIEEVEKNCFLSNLSAAEIKDCVKVFTMSVLEGALLTRYSDLQSALTKTVTIDSNGVDLSKLSEGKTVKVFENKPTEESPLGNETTVTYTRKGNIINIETVIVLTEGGTGTVKYNSTISLE